MVTQEVVSKQMVTLVTLGDGDESDDDESDIDEWRWSK